MEQLYDFLYVLFDDNRHDYSKLILKTNEATEEKVNFSTFAFAFELEIEISKIN